MIWYLWHIFQCQLSLFQVAFYVQITVDSLIWPEWRAQSQAGWGVNTTVGDYKGVEIASLQVVLTFWSGRVHSFLSYVLAAVSMFWSNLLLGLVCFTSSCDVTLLFWLFDGQTIVWTCANTFLSSYAYMRRFCEVYCVIHLERCLVVALRHWPFRPYTPWQECSRMVYIDHVLLPCSTQSSRQFK